MDEQDALLDPWKILEEVVSAFEEGHKGVTQNPHQCLAKMAGALGDRYQCFSYLHHPPFRHHIMVGYGGDGPATVVEWLDSSPEAVVDWNGQEIPRD